MEFPELGSPARRTGGPDVQLSEQAVVTAGAYYPYCTERVKVVDCATLPEVPVTVIVEEPTGVPL